MPKAIRHNVLILEYSKRKIGALYVIVVVVVFNVRKRNPIGYAETEKERVKNGFRNQEIVPGMTNGGIYLLLS